LELDLFVTWCIIYYRKKDLYMAIKSSAQSKHVNNMMKSGSPRKSKKKKGNAPGRTVRSGTGRKAR